MFASVHFCGPTYVLMGVAHHQVVVGHTREET